LTRNFIYVVKINKALGFKFGLLSNYLIFYFIIIGLQKITSDGDIYFNARITTLAYFPFCSTPNAALI